MPSGIPRHPNTASSPWNCFAKLTMATTQIPPDFKDFLTLLNSHHVEYLLIGGYAVAYHGYPRTTGDIDIWIAQNPANAQNVSRTLQAFGFPADNVSPDLFLVPNKVNRIGIAPLRIEILTAISGVTFAQCWPKRETAFFDTIPIPVIDLASLKANKQASARPKDIEDLRHLP